MYWAVQNTPRTHLLGTVLCLKCFEINFFPKIPKIRCVNFKIIFFKMQFFYSQFQNTLTQQFLHFLVYFFLKTIIYNLLDYLNIHICRLMVPFYGAHHIFIFTIISRVFNMLVPPKSDLKCFSLSYKFY